MSKVRQHVFELKNTLFTLKGKGTLKEKQQKTQLDSSSLLS